MGFKRDFSLGRNGEDIVLALLKRAAITIEKNTDKNTRKDYDLIGKIDKKNLTIEVKYDYMAVKTGNLALEYHNSKKDEPSGIDATKAKVWAHIILDNGNPTVWITSVKNLKSYVKSTTPHKTINKAGDGNAELYLYRIDDILPAIFTRIDNIVVSDIEKIIKKYL